MEHNAEATAPQEVSEELRADYLTPNEVADKIKASRGAQLRALVISWFAGDTYQRALQEQATALAEEGLIISTDWAEMADSILQSYADAMTAPEVFGANGRPLTS